MTETSTIDAIPPFLAGRALKSMRDSGFDLPTALGEVIDNSLEAKSNHITVDMREVSARGKRKAVDRIAIVDDGIGMSADILHHYLQIGFSTRYMRTDTIGKYGVGATTAALNFATCIDVWSRDAKAGPIRHVRFDLDASIEAEERGEPVLLMPPDETALPDDLAALFPPGTGTLVVWSKIDRLADGCHPYDPGALRAEVQRELSRIFREQLAGGKVLRLQQGGDMVDLLPHDPTFRLEKTWADRELAENAARAHPGGRDGWMKDKTRKTHFGATVIFDEDVAVGDSKIRVAVTVYPPDVTRTRGKGNDNLAKKLRVPDNEGKISFLRKGREISYTTVPMIFGGKVQEQDRFIGVEVRFDPDLDHMMGVRNVKRGAEPNGDMRLALRHVLTTQHKTARGVIQDQWQQASRSDSESQGEHAPVNEAVKDVSSNMPTSRAASETSEDAVDQAFEDLASDIGKREPAERDTYIERVRQMPFVVESVDWPGDQLFEIVHAGQTTIVRLNKRHRFYREVYAPLRALSQQDVDTVTGEDAVAVARRAAEAMTLLFIAYAKAESMHENPDDQYNELRGWWGNFANYLLGKVKDVLD